MIITAATPDYEEHLGRLMRSLDRFGLDYHVYPWTARETWASTCNLKPETVRDALDRWDHVVWLDADAELKQRPDLLLDEPYDFAICNRPDLGFGSGTMGFRRGAWNLVTLWCGLAVLEPEEWDQRLLQQAWQMLDGGPFAPSTLWLPAPYLQKIDDPDGAVVLHYQASRTRSKP